VEAAVRGGGYCGKVEVQQVEMKEGNSNPRSRAFLTQDLGGLTRRPGYAEGADRA
jgi:hypothetical protein